MSAPRIVLRQEDSTELFTEFTINADGGTPTDPVVIDVWNTPDDPLGELAKGVRLNFYARTIGGAWNQDEDLIAARWIECEVTGDVGGSAESYIAGWTPAGRSKPFQIRPIPADSFRRIRFRVNAPGSAGSIVLEVSIEPEIDGLAIPLGFGFYAAGLQGIASGVGDGSRSFIIEGGAMTPSGSPDDKITISDLVSLVEGRILVDLEHQETIDGNAADGALASAQAYWVTLSKGSGAGLTQTKSNKGAAPLSIGLRPEAPAGELILGWIHRDFDAAIASGDLYDGREFGSFLVTGTGLDRTIGGGHALCDDRLAVREQPSPATFPASEATIGVYMLPSGQFQIDATGERPDPRALLLWRAVSDGSDLTSLEDVRPFLRTRPLKLSFRFNAALAADQFSYLAWPGEADGVITYPVACEFVLDSNPTDNTGGTNKADLYYSIDGGASWVSVFSSSGTVDRRPAIPADETNLRAVGTPEVRIIPRGALLRAKIVSVVTGGTAPSGAEFILHTETPGG